MPATPDTVFYSCKAFFQCIKADIVQPDIVTLFLGFSCRQLCFMPAQGSFLREAYIFAQAVFDALKRYLAALQAAPAVLSGYLVHVNDNTEIRCLRL